MGRNLADVEYKMRMTQELKEKIVESAKEHNRSMNADIVARLEQSFEDVQNQESEITGLKNHISHLTDVLESQNKYWDRLLHLIQKDHGLISIVKEEE